MLIHKLVNNLKIAEDSQWQSLVLEVLGNEIHPNRAKSFCLAREALKECVKNWGYELKISDLKLVEFRQIESLPALTLSLSHTNDWGAAVVADTKEYLSVGIDIEPHDRIVKKQILDRISHEQDVLLEPIKKWALKEACFKALMNSGNFQAPMEFSSIQILQEGWKHAISGLSGRWEVLDSHGLLTALAWIKA